MLAPTPRRGGSYTSRGRTHDGCDGDAVVDDVFGIRPVGDSGQAATECHRRHRHQASTTT
jgi:hypothetical protein